MHLCKFSSIIEWSLATHFWSDLLFAVCGKPKNDHVDVSRGSLEVDIEQQPWVVSIGSFQSDINWDHQCSGSLVTNKHVLTAARCLAGALSSEAVKNE